MVLIPAACDPVTRPITFRTPRRLTPGSASLEHIPFAMFLIDLLKPDVLVALGTRTGDSYCALCEAVDALGLQTRCFAVDSWGGDPRTGASGPKAFEELRAHHDALYGRFSRLVPSTFDEAAEHFADGGIDVLHMGSPRTYEAVRRDFGTWRSKMSGRGVILLHDIDVREPDVGVWRAWEELAAVYPSFRFAHARGLGVLGVGQALPVAIRELLALRDEASAAFRQYFHHLGHRLRLLADAMAAERGLAEERAERERIVARLRAELQQAREQELPHLRLERTLALELLRERLREEARELEEAKEEAAEQARAVEWLKGEVRRVEAEAAERARAADVEAELARVREQELRTLQLEADRLRHRVQAFVNSWSWKVTAPLRAVWSIVGILTAIPQRLARRAAGLRDAWSRTVSGLREAWSLTVSGLRDAWYRTAWTSVSLRALTPVAIDAGPQNPQQVVCWIPPVHISRVSKPTFLAHPPARVTYRFTVPPRAMFRSLIALKPEVWDVNTGGVDFSVSVSADSTRLIVQRRWRIEPRKVAAHRRWTSCGVWLGRFAGQEVELTLVTSLPAEASADFAHAVWGDPSISTRKPAREIWDLCATALTLRGVRGVLGSIRRGVPSPAARNGFAIPTRSVVPAAALSRGATSSAGLGALLEQSWKDKLRLFLADPSSALVFAAVADPLVSIVIPTFNKAQYLYQCLEGVLAHTSVPFEVIVVDDCSQDDTPALLERLENVTCVRNERNQDFIRTCNRGIALARGRYLAFVNNDVTVTPGWLSGLVETMEGYPGCGAVQGKLVRPDGTLQEAGSIIWRDGSAAGYGRDDDPLKPEYCYLREVDFGSAACLLIRADLVRRLGGFDERYAPAYYEDADLCFGVRSLGYKVVFQPRVNVFHYEFGSRSSQRAAALCAANQPRFADKWARELGKRHGPGEVLRARDCREGKRILVIDDQIPSPHLGSGFPRTWAMLHLLADLGLVITFLPLMSGTPHRPATQRLQQLGIEVLYWDGFSLDEFLRRRAGLYDVILVSRPHNGAHVLPVVRQHFPRALVVYDAEALFCVREFRKAELDGRALSEAAKRAMLRRELGVVRHADVVTTVSASERDLIVPETGHPNVAVWGHPHPVHAAATPFAERRDLLFVGGFLNGHPPNTDAVLSFASALFPKIREKLSDCRLVIVGMEPPESVRELASPHIVVAGYVEDLTEYYEQCRVFVVPLRFGAGISLKLIEAMSYGIPTVTTTLGAAGLDLDDGREALIATNGNDFADKVVRLYEDEAVWTSVQRAAQQYIGRRCSPEAMRSELGRILGVGR